MDLKRFLDRTFLQIGKGKVVENTFITAVKNTLNLTLAFKNIVVQKNTVFIKGDRVIKNEIVLNKTKILQEVRKINPKIKIDNIT